MDTAEVATELKINDTMTQVDTKLRIKMLSKLRNITLKKVTALHFCRKNRLRNVLICLLKEFTLKLKG